MKENKKAKPKTIEGCIEIEKNEMGFICLYLNTKKYGRIEVQLSNYKNVNRIKRNRKLIYKMFIEA